MVGGSNAFAQGTAYAGLWRPISLPSGSGSGSASNSGSSTTADAVTIPESVVEAWEDTSDNLSDAADNLEEATNDFEETFDWVEVRIAEIDEKLSLLNSQLENAIYYTNKNSIIDSMIGVNETKMTNLAAGLEKYTEYAAQLLAKIPAQYQAAAQDGMIAITEFAGEADEATVDAINNYREWAQKVADLRQELEETKTTIRDLAIEKFNNAYDAGDIRATVEDSQTEKLQNAVDYDEARGLITSDAYYIAMMENSNKKIEYLTNAREAMQKELNAAVEAGQIVRGSNEWYELIDQMYEIDASIDEAVIELEDFQNAINDLYWDNFDELINRIDYLKNDTQSLIDLMDNADMVIEPEGKTYEGGTIKYWTADDVEWTKEGLATLGLYAQQMEIAEYRARQYAQAIDDLTIDYKNGKYSENEYLEKLNDLKDAQYDSIEAYYDAQDAIKDLNSTRVDAIKNGIEKEIDAYEELIKKQKEELSSEKDMHDFQKSIADQQKNISDIQRKLAALQYDNSMSAIAKRRELEAELAEAQADLQESYYDRSVSDKQDALDKELESFQDEKNSEIEKWDEYLEDLKQVIADSLLTVQANAFDIYDTLNEKANEYDLTISEAVTSPWKDGAIAVSDYQTAFDTAASSTMDQLDAIKTKWQEIIDKMAEAGESNVNNINQENANYAGATYTPPATTTTSVAKTTTTSSSLPAFGQTVKVRKTATHFSAQSGYAKMASFVPGGTYQVMQVGVNGDKTQILIGKNGQYTGWVNLHDLEGYAKGTKEIKKDQLAWLDELGEELVLNAGPDGRLQYISKGSSVIPAKLTDNLMKLGQLDPQDILDRNRPSISAPHIVNNNMELNLNVEDIVRIDTVTNDTIPDLTDAIDKQLDTYMKKLNAQIRRYSR